MREEEEEVVQRETPLIFLAHPQKQEVVAGSPGEPGGARSVSSGEPGVGFAVDPPPESPEAERVGLQISLMKPPAPSLQAGEGRLQKMSGYGREIWIRCS
ncbi:hypothetical protein PBY51_002439 [Eleginops maclovinus]|uniref:Uncharacterized protein n=1 Tax=Eleginops maclovinus TaxID=56733 RepID=A0AAN7X603_ELEMC|nr:hypothetical protein PBY51_002439 [Eleginops maclovinus]